MYFSKLLRLKNRKTRKENDENHCRRLKTIPDVKTFLKFGIPHNTFSFFSSGAVVSAYSGNFSKVSNLHQTRESGTVANLLKISTSTRVVHMG